jgi:aminoglycoside 6'-N-acetyltransferase I
VRSEWQATTGACDTRRMQVRAAEARDRDQLARMRADLWPDASAEEHAREVDAELSGVQIGPYPRITFVAELEQRVIGFIEAGMRSHVDGCDPQWPCGFIEGWYVSADQRSRGVGQALMARAEAWARAQGCRELGSDTWITSEVSQRAHAAGGFEVVDRCVHFRKQLTPVNTAAAEPAPLYRKALAELHHHHFGHVARAAARSLQALLREAGHSSGRVLDLAAGSGIVSRELSDAGYEVMGVDISEPMLALARVHAPRVTFRRGSLWECALPPCIAIAAIGEALNYRAAPELPSPSLAQRVSQLAAALQPGGVLLFDVAAPGRSGPSGTRRAFWSLTDAAIGMLEQETAAPARLQRDITMFIAQGEQYRREHERHVLEPYTEAEVAAALAQAGLSWTRLPSYEGFELPAGWAAFAARKPRA